MHPARPSQPCRVDVGVTEWLCSDKQQPVFADRPMRQRRVVDLPLDNAQVGLAVMDARRDLPGVADRQFDADRRVARMESREDRW